MSLSLKSAIAEVFWLFESEAEKLQPARWQGQDVSSRPEAQMYELLHTQMIARLGHPQTWAEHIEPNLPWAENHFLERVSGTPMNPGTEWANWPFGVNAEKVLDKEGMFNHNYMERYWPKYAHLNSIPTVNAKDWNEKLSGYRCGGPGISGIRHQYGDLFDLVLNLANEPDTRQAYLPVWFPEDTGAVHTGRKPCTLGYHFIVRNGRLDVTYYMRSCDLANHFRDDIYLTARLGQWMLEQCKVFGKKDNWRDIQLGRLVVNITSLHMFVNDYRKIYG